VIQRALGRLRRTPEDDPDRIEVEDAGASGFSPPFDVNALPPPDLDILLNDEYIDDEPEAATEYESSHEEVEASVKPRVFAKKRPSSKETSQHLAFTKSNPLGQALLHLLEDNLKIQEKCGITESHISAKDFCSAFHEQMLLERNKIQRDLAKASSQTEKRILTSEISSMSNFDEELIPEFGRTPKLITNSATIEATRIFPVRNKFSGGADSPSLQEFFAALRTAQEQCRLTEREFLRMLLNCTSGKAHELVQSWVDASEDAKSIFFNLTLMFDKRMSPEQARMKLTNLMAPKSTDLARHIAFIMSLAQRASCALPPGSSRTNYFNTEAVSTLIRSLPPNSKVLASNLYHSLSAKAKRGLTYNELARPLINLRDTIDADIKLHGAGGGVVQQKSHTSKNKRHNGKHTSYSVNATEDVSNFKPPQYKQQQQQQPQQRSSNAHWGNKTRANQVSQKPNGNSAHQIHVNQTNGNNQGPSFGTHQNYNGARPKQFRNKKRYCSLCGQGTHTAAQGCRNIRDDSGKIVPLQPCQSTCSVCPSTVTPRLNHPSVLCPFRVNGPLYGR
jgi:hypothetical protein